MKNLKKYVSLNLLSLLGYIFLALVLIFTFFVYPDAIRYDRSSGEDAAYGLAWAIITAVGTIFVYTIVELVLLLVFILELLIYKFTKTEPRIINISEKFKKIHLWIFVFGILLSMLPLAGCLYFLFHSV